MELAGTRLLRLGKNRQTRDEQDHRKKRAQSAHEGNYRNSRNAASIGPGSAFVALPIFFKYSANSDGSGARTSMRFPVRGCSNARRAE